MIAGRVTGEREAVVPLLIEGPGGNRLLEVVIDTGFTGFLTLSGQVVDALELPLIGHRRATLADGRSVLVGAYIASVHWHDGVRAVLALRTEGGALAGMSLLDGSRLTVDVVENGIVTVEAIAI